MATHQSESYLICVILKAEALKKEKKRKEKVILGEAIWGNGDVVCKVLAVKSMRTQI